MSSKYIYICDRCGKEKIDKISISTVHWSRIFLMDFPHTKNNDLCEECYDKLIKFLKGSEK